MSSSAHHPLQYKKPWRDPSLYLSFIAVLAAAAANGLGSVFIGTIFPDRPHLPDLGFTYLPYIPQVQNLTDYANFGSGLVVFIYLFFQQDASRRMTRGFYILAYAYALRAVLIVLTPFGSSLDDPSKQYGATNIQQNGSFPSGHTIMVVVAFALLDKRDNLWVPALLGLSVVVEVVCLLISHGHYTLDIAGSFLVAYVAYYEIERLMKKKPR